MNTHSHHAALLEASSGTPWYAWGVVAAIQLMFAVAGVMIGWQAALVPLVVLVVAISFAWPRASLYILATVIYFRYALPGTMNVYPADAMAFVVMAGVFLRRLLRGESIIEHNWANRWLALIIIAFAVSLLVAFDFSLGFKNWLRHVQLIGLMAAIATCLERDDIFALIRWMVILTAIFCFGNILTYILVGEEKRTFGPTGQFFATFTVLACLRAAVGFLMSQRKRASAGWGIVLGICGMGLLVTQTRAAMIQLVLAMCLLLALVWFWGRRSRQPYLQWRSFLFASAMVLSAVVILADLVPLLHRPSARLSEVLEGRAPTVDMRMFLWKTGLHAFIDSPILGIGLGQIAQWDQFLNYWRLDVGSITTKGLGAHNNFITYIAETGVVGTLPLLWFLWRMFATGARELRRARSHAQVTEIMIVWMPVAAMVLAYFFRTHIFYSLDGMLTSFYFAFWIKYSTLLQTSGAGIESATPRLSV